MITVLSPSAVHGSIMFDHFQSESRFEGEELYAPDQYCNFETVVGAQLYIQDTLWKMKYNPLRN